NNSNPLFLDNLKIEIEQLPKAPYGYSERSGEIAQKVNPLLNNAREGNNGERKIEKIYLQNMDLIPQKANPKDEISNLEAFCDLDSQIDKRRKRAGNYKSLIRNDQIKHPELENGSPLFRYTLLIDGKNGPRLRRRITNQLRTNGIHASNLYYSAHLIFRWDSSKKLANSTWVQDRVINLWLDDIADEEYIQKTAELIDEIIDE
ncbi:MAG: DegT/DnrJ/EryC1/StrS family aminotransferase, partial [bacterium]